MRAGLWHRHKENKNILCVKSLLYSTTLGVVFVKFSHYVQTRLEEDQRDQSSGEINVNQDTPVASSFFQDSRRTKRVGCPRLLQNTGHTSTTADHGNVLHGTVIRVSIRPL
jgi:hypothetical protein